MSNQWPTRETLGELLNRARAARQLHEEQPLGHRLKVFLFTGQTICERCYDEIETLAMTREAKRWEITCEDCGEVMDKSDDARHDCINTCRTCKGYRGRWDDAPYGSNSKSNGIWRNCPTCVPRTQWPTPDMIEAVWSSMNCMWSGLWAVYDDYPIPDNNEAAEIASAAVRAAPTVGGWVWCGLSNMPEPESEHYYGENGTSPQPCPGDHRALMIGSALDQFSGDGRE